MRPNQNIITVFLFFVLPLLGQAQSWVADSLTISFGQNDSLQTNVRFNAVSDSRNEASNFLSVYEKKRCLFFPVDQIVISEQPLSQCLQNRFQTDSMNVPVFNADIKRFYLKQTSGFRNREVTLFSTLELSELNQSDTTFLGTMYYEFPFLINKKEGIDVAFEQTIDSWNKQLSKDLLLIDNEIDLVLEDELYYFRRGAHAINKNFYTEVEVFGGLNFWGVDGELWFSEPEGNRIFNRQVGIMRYVNKPQHRAIAVGRNVRMWNYRLNENLLFTNKMAMLIGFNNWKDMETVSHKLEEILYFDLSFSQRINFNRLDKEGLMFGIGIMEDVNYIIYHKPQINIGLTLNCAYKF